MLLTSGLIQGPCILKTGFFKPWETSHWPSICCVSGPTLTRSGSPTFRPSPASTTPPSTSRRMRFATCSPHRPYTTSSASTRTRRGSTPTSTRSSRWAGADGAGEEETWVLECRPQTFCFLREEAWSACSVFTTCHWDVVGIHDCLGAHCENRQWLLPSHESRDVVLETEDNLGMLEVAQVWYKKMLQV